MRASRGEFKDAASDALHHLPVFAAINAARHAIATGDEEMSGFSRNGEDARDATKGQCACAGKVLPIIHAHLEAICLLFTQINVDLIRAAIAGLLCEDVACADAGCGCRQFPDAPLVGTSIESYHA